MEKSFSEIIKRNSESEFFDILTFRKDQKSEEKILKNSVEDLFDSKMLNQKTKRNSIKRSSDKTERSPLTRRFSVDIGRKTHFKMNKKKTKKRLKKFPSEKYLLNSQNLQKPLINGPNESLQASDLTVNEQALNFIFNYQKGSKVLHIIWLMSS